MLRLDTVLGGMFPAAIERIRRDSTRFGQGGNLDPVSEVIRMSLGYTLPEVNDEVLVALRNGPWRPVNPASNSASIASQIRARYPNGVDVAVIVPAAAPGWSPVITSNGFIAILIGLLLPAVQQIRERPSAGRSTNTDARALRAVLKAGGKLGIGVVKAAKNEVSIESIE